MADDPVTRARALLGAPFRLHGRGTDGIDCIGLIAAAFEEDAIPTGYALRTATLAPLLDALVARGFVASELASGALVALRPGPAQLHLGIWTGVSLIHADAGIGRVVETPGRPANILGIWQPKGDSWQRSS